MKPTKKHFSNLLIILLILISIIGNTAVVFADVAVFGTSVLDADATLSEDHFQFACMSDLHLDDLLQKSPSNRTQFTNALKKSVELGYDDLFVSLGDLSSFGQTSVWDETKKAAEGAGYNQIVWALGNHEYGLLGGNSDAGKDFKSFANVDKIYHDDVVNGYHFICFGAERTDAGIGDLVYSVEQEDWIVERVAMAAAEDPSKPIFVCSHYPIGRTRIEQRLSQYKNVFFFWGHQHDDEWENYTIDRYIDTSKNFVTARVGCMHYGYSDISDSLLVDVYKDRVELTLERVSGKKMNNNHVIVYLNLALPDAVINPDALTLYDPVLHAGAKIYIGKYDANGKMISCEIIDAPSAGDVAAGQDAIKAITVKSQAGVAYMKAFLLQNYIPIVI